MKVKSRFIYLADLHFEHLQWSKELLFWGDEIKTYHNRLGEIVTRWTDKDVLAQIEHFQNQFILHKEVIDILLHDINAHESELAKFAESHQIAIDHVHFDDHTEFRTRMDRQRELYNEMKKEFFSFMRKTM